MAAMGVHVFTASGIIPAAAAAIELCSEDPDPRRVFVYFLLTTLIDALDGPLARKLDVKTYAASIDGRTIDDILDYLTFAFLPLLLVYRMDWLADGLQWTFTLGCLASLLGFANVTAKDDDGGFFRGFPSYWNIYAFYAGWMHELFGPWPGTILLWALTVATVSPIWLLYPNKAPRPWKWPVLLGAAVWALALLIALPNFPENAASWFWWTLIYPAFYCVASLLAKRQRRDPDASSAETASDRS